MHRSLIFAPAMSLLVGCASQPHHPSDAHFGQWAFVPPEPTVLEEKPTPQPSWTYESRPDISPRDLPAALRFLEALVELERIRRGHPERSEAVFNEAILIQEYGVLLETKHHETTLLVARNLYRHFLGGAKSDPDMHDQVRRAKDRLMDIENLYFCDFKTPASERRRIEAEAAEREARETREWEMEAAERDRQREDAARREAETPADE